MLKQLIGPAWVFLEYAWYPLLLFSTTPWFLRQLGAEQYGHWMLLTATVALGGLLNAGTGAATVKAVSSAIGRGNGADVGPVVRASLAIAILGGAVLASIVLLVLGLAGPTLLSRMGEPALLHLTAAAAAALLWLEQLDTVCSSALKGAERFSHAARIEILSKTVQVVSAALVLLVHRRLWLLYASLIAVCVARLLAKATLVRRELDVDSLQPRLRGARGLLHVAKWGWLQGLGGVLFGVVDRMLVGSLLGAASLAYYAIASQLAMQVHAASAAALSVVFPKVSRKLEGPAHFSLWRITRVTMIGNLLVSTLVAAALLLYGDALLHAWLGSTTATPTVEVLPWLVGAYWILALSVVPYYVLLGMGRMRRVGLTVLVAGMLGIATAWLGIEAFGLPGAAVGRATYAMVSLALLVPLVRYLRSPRGAGVATGIQAQDLPP